MKQTMDKKVRRAKEDSVQTMAMKIRTEMGNSVQSLVAMAKKVRRESVQIKAKKKPTTNLPGDLIESNILTRLPVKTLIRFTSVCKSWCSLLSNPYFVNLYNQIQKTKINNPLLLVDYFHEKRIVVTDNRSSSGKQSSSWLPFVYTTNPKFPCKDVNVVGCCDGIVCIFDCSANINNGISLWNPALRINKIVSSYHQPSVCLGFGYNRRTNDHNIIKFYNENFRLSGVEIYSLSSDSWRKIELDSNQLLTERYLVDDQFGVCVSSRLGGGGAYCWLAYKRDYKRYTIISFCAEDNAFKEINLPYSKTDLCVTLFNYKDSLAVLHAFYPDTQESSRMYYIWVMKEHDDPNSWTMLCSIFDSPSRFVSFVGVIESELMLLRCGNRDSNVEVIVIDIAKSQKKTVNSVKGIGLLKKASWVSSFYESLVLLKGVDSKNSCTN